MPSDFFPPPPAFAWLFCAALVALTATAAWIDLRRLVIPKSLTLTALALGVLLNGVRGAWLGAFGGAVWKLGANGATVGAADAVLFSAVGFATGFALFFVMWVLGTCGGGDVKLFAALGAWVGPLLTVFVLVGTLVLVVLFGMARLIGTVVFRGRRSAMRQYSAKAAGGPTPRRRLTAYSLPVALSTACVLLWVFRAELRLAPPRAVAPADQVSAVR
jgi:Flp pilus assembly protein protease CpaA